MRNINLEEIIGYFSNSGREKAGNTFTNAITITRKYKCHIVMIRERFHKQP